MSRLKRAIVVAALAVVVPAPSQATGASAAPAEASFSGIQHVRGYPGLRKKSKGTLIVPPDQVRFLDNKGRAVFTLGLDAATLATPSEGRTKSAGRIALVVLTMPMWMMCVGTGMGDPPSFSAPAYFVAVHAQTPSGMAEVTFRCPRKDCGAIATVIDSQAAAARGRQ